MPTISRAKRQKARIKRSNSLLKRGLRTVMQQAQQASITANQNLVILVAVLNQLGGEVTLPKTLIDTVAGKIQTSGFAVTHDPVENTFRVYVTDSSSETVDAADLSPETLAEMKARMDAVHNGEVPAYTPPAGSVAGQLAAVRTADQGGDTADAPDATDPA